jgi:hypothetical protein
MEMPDACRNIQNQFSEYLDDRLSEPAKAAVEAHAAGCPRCGPDLDGLKRARAWLRETPALVPPDSFYRNVREKIAARPAARPWHFYGLRGLAAASVLLMVGLVVKETGRSPDLFRRFALPDQEKAAPALDASQRILSLELKPTDQRVSGGVNMVSRDREDGSSRFYPGTEAGRLETSEIRQKSALPSHAGAPAPTSTDPFQPDSVGDKKAALRLETGESIGELAQPTKSPYAESLVAEEAERKRVSASQAPVSSKRDFERDKVYYERNTAPTDSDESLAFEPPRTLGGTVAAKPQAAPAEKRAARVQEWKGFYSGVSSPKNIVVRSQKEWEDLLAQHQGAAPPQNALLQSGFPPPPLPASVDFRSSMAVAVFAGQKPTAGHAIEMTAIQPEAGRIVVSYRETAPGPDRMAAQVLTSPYHIKIVPRSDLPVLFQRIR